MASSQPREGDPAERIRVILSEIMQTLDKFDEIHQIAEQERQRVGEDTPEGDAWYAFGGVSPLTDVGRAWTNMQSQVMAVRGYLVWRQLDSSQVGFVPLNQVRAQKSE